MGKHLQPLIMAVFVIGLVMPLALSAQPAKVNLPEMPINFSILSQVAMGLFSLIFSKIGAVFVVVALAYWGISALANAYRGTPFAKFTEAKEQYAQDYQKIRAQEERKANLQVIRNKVRRDIASETPSPFPKYRKKNYRRRRRYQRF